jgi:hypothetical protein
VKVQVLDQEFKSQGCELRLNDRLNSVERLAGGGEAKLSGVLNLLIRDKAVTGRFQVYLVSEQAGLKLLTGRAVYNVRGQVGEDGSLKATLAPMSNSGDRVLRQMLEKEGSLTGIVQNGRGSGKITVAVLKDSLDWQDSHQDARSKRRQ